MKQVEYSQKVDLLDKKGRLIADGYSKRLVFKYKRALIRRKTRIKEWDFYQIMDDDFVLQMNISSIAYLASIGSTLINLKTGERYSFNVIKPLMFNKLHMEENGEEGYFLSYIEDNFHISFDSNGSTRVLKMDASNKNYKSFKIDITLTANADNESMVKATPFTKPEEFYLNYKTNCMVAKGTVNINGQIHEFNKNAFGLLDWGRGVWPYSAEWYWGNGSLQLDDGRLFGFNVGYGFGNNSNATENMLFLNGKAHKLEEVTLQYDENNIMNTWTFSSSDKRFEMTMKPLFDNYTKTNVGPLYLQCHQVFGYFSGYVIMDDNEKIQINNMLAFCEHAKNKW